MKKKTTPLINQSRYSVRHLACVRGDTPLFNDITFDISAHECLHITGPNGSGKSSLLKILAGLSPPSAGDLLWCDTKAAPAGHTLHYISHELALSNVLTPYDNLLFWAQARRPPNTPQLHKRVRASLRTLAIDHLGTVPCALLSAGQKKRASLARLLIDESTPLWLLDEPYANLDSKGQKTLATIIEHAQQNGTIIIVARHKNAPERNLPCSQIITL